MDTRIAILGIIVEDPNSANAVHELLHDAASYIIGRMGIPYHERKISIISVALDAPNDVINSLAGRLGSLPGVSARAVYAKR